MVGDIYKDTTIELYINKIKEENPNIEDYIINSLKNAFRAGFNMGTMYDKPNEFKELALKMMCK